MYYLTPKSYAGSSLSGSLVTIFGPNEVARQPESSTITAKVIGGYPTFVDVERQGRQFALWVQAAPGTSASARREDINRIFDTSREPDELVVEDTSGCRRVMFCRPLSVHAHPQLANAFIVRLEAPDPRWFNANETIQTASISLAAPIQRGNKTMLSACAQYSQAIVYDAAYDSDGGRWRDSEQTKHSSWYAETGSSFPRRAVIEWKDGAGTGVRIWNADTGTVYMDLASGSNDMLPLYPIRDVAMRDGLLAIAHDNSGCARLLSFRDDFALQIGTGGVARYNGNIRERSASRGYSILLPDLTLNSATACGIAMQSILGTPYVAISTSQLTTLWHPMQQRAVQFGSGSDSHRAPYLSPGGDLYFFNMTDGTLDIYRGAVWFTENRTQEQADESLSYKTEPAIVLGNTTCAIAQIVGTPGMSAVDGQGDVIFVGHTRGVTRLDMAQTNTSAMAVQWITACYISEIMPGAAKGMWPFHETESGSIAPNTLVSSVAARIYAGNVRTAQIYSPTGIAAAAVKPPRGFGVEGNSSAYLYNRIIAGCTTGVATNKLISASGGSPFLGIGIQTGDEAINYSNGSKATITGIDSGTQLSLDKHIFTAASQTYDIQSGGLSASGYDHWYISTWWYPTSMAGLRYLVVKGLPVAAASRSYAIYKPSGSASIKWEVSANGVSSTTLTSHRADGTTIDASPRQWLHILAIYDTDASALRLWLNGSAAGSATHTGGIYNTLTPFIIGARATGSANIDSAFIGTLGPTMVGTWTGSLNWSYLASRIYLEGKRALDLANASQSRLYGTSNNVTSLAISRDGNELIVGTASPGGAVSFIEWASGYRVDEYDPSSGDTDDNGSAFDLADIERVSLGDNLLAISGSTAASAHRLWVEQHFPAALTVTNQGNVDADVTLSFRPRYEKQVGWRRAQVFSVWNPTDKMLARYPVMLTLDTAALIARQQLSASGYDLRVLINGEEIPRYIYGLNTASTQVWFTVDLPPRARVDGWLLYDNPTATAPSQPPEWEPAFAWDSGSCNNTTWVYTDFGSKRAGQVMAWQPVEFLPGVDPGALDRFWVTRTQGGGGGVGEVKTLRLTITNDAFDAYDRGFQATFNSSGHLFLGKYTGTSSSKYNVGFLFRQVPLAAGDRILSARLLVKCQQEMGEGFIAQQRPDLATGTTYQDYILYSPDNGDRGEVRLRIYGEANASAAAFSSTCRPGQRALTSSSRAWHITDLTTPQGWSGVGGGWRDNIYYESPNFASVIQEIIDLPNWNSGQDMAIIIKDDESFGSGKAVRFYTAPGVPLRRPDGSVVSEDFWYPAHRKIANQATGLLIEYMSGVSSTPMADVDPWNDLAVVHARQAIAAGESFRNGWALSVPAGVVQVQHAGQFRVMSQLSAPGSASATLISTETNNANWTTGSKFYAVSALNAKGETTLGEEGSVAVSAADVSKPIRVRWTGVRKATGYRLYRGTTTGVYDTVYEVSGDTTSFLDKNDPGQAAVVSTENTATVNAWQLYLRNAHGKLVPMFRTSASTESAMAGYGAFIDSIYRYDSGPGTFSANLAGSTDFPYWPASASNGDIVYFGAASKFYGLFFNVETAGSYTNTIAWEYYKGSWSSFTPAYDDTAASSGKPWSKAGSGAIGWDEGDVGGWVKTSVNSQNRYWVRARIASGTTLTACPINGSVRVGPATTPTASLAFSSDMVVFALEPDTQMAADGQGAFTEQVTLKLEPAQVIVITTGSMFLSHDIGQEIRVWSDLEQDAESVLVRGTIRLERDVVVVNSASGGVYLARTGERLAAKKKPGPRRKLLRLTPGQNIVQLSSEAGNLFDVMIKHRDTWN